jgi:hypothetical protein
MHGLPQVQTLQRRELLRPQVMQRTQPVPTMLGLLQLPAL